MSVAKADSAVRYLANGCNTGVITDIGPYSKAHYENPTKKSEDIFYHGLSPRRRPAQRQPIRRRPTPKHLQIITIHFPSPGVPGFHTYTLVRSRMTGTRRGAESHP